MRRRNAIFFAGCALFLIFSAWLVFFYLWLGIRDRVVISHESGIYEDGTQVTVRIFRKGTVYYTADGREPAPDWANVCRYEGPLTLEASDEGSVYSIRFFCQFADGELTELQERNYVVLADDRKISTDYIVTVRGNERELFSDEEGIFVRGNLYYEYRRQRPNVNILSSIIPANYYSNRELEVHTAVFTGQGQEILAQDCGLKIYGNVTRAKNQKSFRLIARYEYDTVNEFSYPFFDCLISENTGTPLPAYQRLSLHNSGNDNGYGFLRNTLCNELARQAGFPDVLVSKSAAVYINDRYMGVYWLQNDFDDRYFKEKYGTYQGEMAVSEGTLSEMEESAQQEEWERESAEDYNDFCEWLSEADVNDPKVWQRVEETVDVDNLIRYVALEYYVNNIDWPNNNVKVYRYVPAEGEEYREGTVFDGRYRYLLFDLDYGMGLKFLGWFGRDAKTEILGQLCDIEEDAGPFAKLMEREDCRDRFISEVLNLRNGSFSRDNVIRVMDEFNDSRWDELEYMMESTDILKDSLWEPDDNSIENVKDELETIRNYAQERSFSVLRELEENWECGELIRIRAEQQEGMTVCVNGQAVNQKNGWYYDNIPITLSLDADRGGIQVSGWYVNGKYLEGETVELRARSYLKNGILEIAPEWEETITECLTIDAWSTRGDQDWVTLKNGGNSAVYLGDWFLSDDPEEPLKGRLPVMTLEPGQCVTVYGDQYDGETGADSCRMDFSWSGEEQVILSHLTRGIVECKSR